MRSRASFLLALFSILSSYSSIAAQVPAIPGTTVATLVQPSAGHFVGVVKTLWNDDGRNMTLLEDFSYVDPEGVEWKAPKGLLTDGASIPREAWTIIGGPFEGPYRLAAVVHDAACNRKDRSWESVHEMFYQAMLTAHVDQVKAKIMYAAVYHFGPRWDLVSKANGIRISDKTAIVSSIQHSLNSMNSEVEVGAKDSTTMGVDSAQKQDLTIRFIPPQNHFSQADFDSLKVLIESRESTSPGSISLEQIRSYHSGNSER